MNLPLGAVGCWAHDDFHHGWLFDDYLLAGEYPWSLGDPARSRAKLDLLVDSGIRTFVDLTHPVDRMESYEPLLAEIAEKRQLDLRRVAHPIPDMGVTNDAGYDNIVATIQDARSRGGVYVHCWGGIGRTSTVVGCYLMDAGYEGFDAMTAAINTMRSETKKAHRPAPQSPAQFDVLRRRAGAHS